MLIKPKITVSPIDKRKLCAFNINHPILGNLSLDSHMEYNNGFKRLYLELKNRQEKILGSEEISLNDENGKMLGLNIIVDPEYRNNGKKNFRFGEILRLASIIEMLENNKQNFRIFSKSTAIYFHSKYKFEPDITSFQDRDNVFKTIAEDESEGFEDLSKMAKENLQQTKICHSNAKQRGLCLVANRLAQKYIDRAEQFGSQGYKAHPFMYGIDMVLTMHNVIKNRTYFNELFKKHGIDYTI